jgi:hypothetical protein
MPVVGLKTGMEMVFHLYSTTLGLFNKMGMHPILRKIALKVPIRTPELLHSNKCNNTNRSRNLQIIICSG